MTATTAPVRPSYVDIEGDDPATIACRMRAAVAPRVSVRSRCHMWSLFLSKDHCIWIFSAHIRQHSTVEDLALLEQIEACIGAPTEKRESIRTTPDAVYEWIWKDELSCAYVAGLEEFIRLAGKRMDELYKRAHMRGKTTLTREELDYVLRPMTVENGHRDCDCAECVAARDTIWNLLAAGVN